MQVGSKYGVSCCHSSPSRQRWLQRLVVLPFKDAPVAPVKVTQSFAAKPMDLDAADRLQGRSEDVSPPPLKRRKVIQEDCLLKNKERRAQQPPKRMLRIFSWNINGIGPFLQPSVKSYFAKDGNSGSYTSLRQFLRRHRWPEILGLQEVKINPNDEATKVAVRKAVNSDLGKPEDTGPKYDVHFCLPRDRYNARGFGGKVYGVATIVKRDFAEKYDVEVRSVDWDLEGRVLVVEIPTLKLSLWNIYAVNGTFNDYRDPGTGNVVGSRHDRKLAFHQHLLTESKSLEEKGYAVVLSGDLNVARAAIDGRKHRQSIYTSVEESTLTEQQKF